MTIAPGDRRAKGTQMTVVTRTRSRVHALVGLIVALAAVITPVALAGTSPNGPFDPWAYALVHRSAAESQQYGPLDPWAYAVIHGQDDMRVASATPEIRSDSSGGMDWGAAGVGAAGAFGLMVLLAGGTFVMRKRTALARPRL
jgi:hypothetical protein